MTRRRRALDGLAQDIQDHVWQRKQMARAAAETGKVTDLAARRARQTTG